VALLCDVSQPVVRMPVRNDPEIWQELTSSPIQRNQPLWGNMLLPVLMLLFVAWLVLVPLYAVGFGWSDVTDWLHVLGALEVMLSFYGMYLLYRYNVYLHPVVKMQEERGQSVATIVPVREVPHVRQQPRTFPGHCSSAGLLAKAFPFAGLDGPDNLKDGPRGPDAEGRAGRLRRVHADLEVPSRSACLVNIDTKTA
jgi:hypothetical protein